MYRPALIATAVFGVLCVATAVRPFLHFFVKIVTRHSGDQYRVLVLPIPRAPARYGHVRPIRPTLAVCTVTNKDAQLMRLQPVHVDLRCDDCLARWAGRFANGVCVRLNPEMSGLRSEEESVIPLREGRGIGRRRGTLRILKLHAEPIRPFDQCVRWVGHAAKEKN